MVPVVVEPVALALSFWLESAIATVLVDTSSVPPLPTMMLGELGIAPAVSSFSVPALMVVSPL